jgi:DNA polymerase III alpha subunit
MGFPGYFFTRLQNFIQWVKDNDAPVNSGRGLRAGSSGIRAKKITDLNLIEHILLSLLLNP